MHELRNAVWVRVYGFIEYIGLKTNGICMVFDYCQHELKLLQITAISAMDTAFLIAARRTRECRSARYVFVRKVHLCVGMHAHPNLTCPRTVDYHLMVEWQPHS